MSAEPVPDTGGGLVRYRATLAYDGTGYHGWARQPGLPTIQESVEDALAVVLRGPAPVTCAGRTDAGVHARGQVIHFDAAPRLASAIARGLNGLLPPAIRVLSVDPVDHTFDARFAALWRRYVYRVTDGPVDPLRRNFVLGVRGALDTEAMDRAAALLIGEHDFGSFCKPREGATTIRRVRAAGWRRSAEESVLTIDADAFCHSMVRSIVGACLLVGRGRREPPWLAELLASPSRVDAAPVAPPHGLVLEEVGYPPPADYAARVRQARSRRRPG